MDLTNVAHQFAVLEWIRHPAVKGVFLAPPCGTASAARNIHIPGESPPQPLRTLDEPDGISSLKGIDLARVSSANMLYGFTVEVLELCCDLGKLCMIENPRNSLFWLTTVMVESKAAMQLYLQDHQACGYGSRRAKWTRLAANFAEVHTIDATCPGNHQHESWGLVQQGAKRVFATALEVHYPTQLCEAIVHAFTLKLVQMGLEFNHPQPIQQLSRAATLEQAPSLKVPPLVPAFKSRVVTFFLNHDLVWPLTMQDLSPCKLLHCFEVGKVVEVKRLKEDAELFERVELELRTCKIEFDVNSLVDNFEFSCDTIKLFGVQWEPEEFLQQACQVSHPMSPSAALPPELSASISACVRGGVVSVARERAEFFKLWNKRAQELQTEEDSLRNSMDPVVERAVSGKRLALFGEMLRYYNYPDPGVLDELTKGASLVGPVDETGMLPFKFTPSLLTVDSLRSQAKFRRKQVLSECRGSGDLEVDMEVWKQTLEECSRGWLVGPLEESQVPENAPISKRFGLRQRHKIRLIDDFTESSVNHTVMVYESPVLHTIDVAGAAVAHWFSCCHEAGLDTSLVARTFDLSSAYRQVGLNAEGRSVAYVRVYNPEKKCWAIFQAQVLPFGAVKSVHSFLRLARAIWWIGVVGCKLFWSSFYDDYIVFSQPALVKSTELTAASLFKLLGWAFAEEGRKCMPFSLQCEALGVVFDLQKSVTGICEITNTASRVEEISLEVERLVQQGHIKQVEAQKLRGRMQFAESQIFGRTGKRCITALKEFACKRKTMLEEKEILFMRLFVSLMKSEVPRQIFMEQKESLVIITDACYERDSRDRVCGLGGVLADSRNKVYLYFSCELDEYQRQLLGELNKKQIIFEAETLCGLLAYSAWSNLFEGRKCFLYVDNEGTKFSLIRGKSENQVVDAIASVFVEVETQVRTLCWVSRVSSYSNIADGPSRGDCALLNRLGFKDVSGEVCRCLVNLLLSVKSKLGKKADRSNPK